jgi:hypothetical protein
VAILHKGELRGVGAVSELTASLHGKVELIWQGNVVPPGLKALGAECYVSGDTARAVLPDKQMDAAIDVLRRESIRLISVNPVRTTLEDYFVQQTAQQGATA